MVFLLFDSVLGLCTKVSHQNFNSIMAACQLPQSVRKVAVRIRRGLVRIRDGYARDVEGAVPYGILIIQRMRRNAAMDWLVLRGAMWASRPTGCGAIRRRLARIADGSARADDIRPYEGAEGKMREN